MVLARGNIMEQCIRYSYNNYMEFYDTEVFHKLTL